MMASALSDPQLQLIAITRAAAVALLVAEALILWLRRREPATDAVTAYGRLFWALIPAGVLLGLSLWCANDLSPGHRQEVLAQGPQLVPDAR